MKTAAQLALIADQLFRDIVQDSPYWRFEIELWDGRKIAPTGPVDSRIIIRCPSAVRALLLGRSTLAFAEAYLAGDIMVDGDLVSIMPLADQLLTRRMPLHKKLSILRRALIFPRGRAHASGHLPARLSGSVGSPERLRSAIAYHYDHPVAFWRLWLDDALQYTCAYFCKPSDSLDDAQRNKLDIICRKLQLEPGQRLLDIGCGWGGLILFAAEHYGVQALGVTLSSAQAEYARSLIAQRRLADRCRVELCDFRRLGAGEFDRISGIGVLEHLGPSLGQAYFEAAYRLLRQGGLFLNQAIACSMVPTVRRGRPALDPFMDKYIFPDGRLMLISDTLALAEQARFEVRDVENIREHYCLTLKHWLSNLESAAGEVRSLASEATYLAFRLYLAGAFHNFRVGRIAVHQTLFSKSHEGKSDIVRCRAEHYRSQSDHDVARPAVPTPAAAGIEAQC